MKVKPPKCTQKNGIRNALPTQLIGSSGFAVSILSTLKPPTITFSSQKSRMRGNTCQPKKSTPARGTALARMRAETEISSRPRSGWPIGDLLGRRPLHHGEGDPGGVLLRMVHLAVRHDAGRLVVVLPAGVHVAVEAGKVAAGDLDPDPVPRLEEIARRHRRERHPVHLARLHHHRRLVVPLPVAGPLDRLVEVVRLSIGVDVEDLE